MLLISNRINIRAVLEFPCALAVKEVALSLLWFGSQLWLRFDPWPGNFQMPPACPKYTLYYIYILVLSLKFHHYQWFSSCPTSGNPSYLESVGSAWGREEEKKIKRRRRRETTWNNFVFMVRILSILIKIHTSNRGSGGKNISVVDFTVQFTSKASRRVLQEGSGPGPGNMDEGGEKNLHGFGQIHTQWQRD